MHDILGFKKIISSRGHTVQPYCLSGGAECRQNQIESWKLPLLDIAFCPNLNFQLNCLFFKLYKIFFPLYIGGSLGDFYLTNKLFIAANLLVQKKIFYSFIIIYLLTIAIDMWKFVLDDYVKK